MNYVFLAGIGNSEPEHWQSVWFRTLSDAGARAHWVEHADWESPNAADWVTDLARALRDMPGPKVLVAHSLGCLLAVEWARRFRDPDVRGSFLVAPPDVTHAEFPKQAVGFGPASDGRPPLPAIVVASTNDPYASFASACAAAAAWGTEIVDVGALGHINLASHLGAWDDGRARLERFIAGLPRP